MNEVTTYLDFYKTFHHKAYKPGVTEVYSNFTARHGGHSNIDGGKTCLVAGLQAFIHKIIDKEWGMFFDAVTADEAVELYETIVSHGLGRPETANHLRDLWQLGYLPLEFRGLKEGTEVPYGLPHFTIKSTLPGFGWLTNMIETVLSSEVWPVHTSLTTAAQYYKVFQEFAVKTGFPEEFVKYQGHDFSFRGMMGVEAAKLSGMGHLMSGFVGSDTIPAAIALHNYYGADISPENPCATIASVDATEHSVQCSFQEDDEAYLDHCMDVASPEGILSIVSDGYDFWKLVTEFIPARKDKIMNRDGKVVIRPDSGDPADILCGTQTISVPSDVEDWKDWVAAVINDIFDDNLDPLEPHESETELFTYLGKLYQVIYTPELNRHDKTYYFIDNCGSDISYCEFTEVEMTPQCKGLVEYLWDIFGGTETTTGHKLLDQHIGCIYGDSITLERQRDILERLEAKGFSSGNVVLGIGSYTYQYVTRDTHGSAVKATNIVMNDNENIAIFKDPKTGDSTKKSAKGLLNVGSVHDLSTGITDYFLEDEVSIEKEQSPDNLLERVWKDGAWYREQTLEEIREIVQNT